MITIELRGDDALQLMLAIDTAMMTLQVRELRAALSDREIDQSLIMLRDLRSTVMRKRADFISQTLKGKSANGNP